MRYSEPIHVPPAEEKSATTAVSKKDKSAGKVQASSSDLAGLLGKILAAFGPQQRGVCIMDEVDLLLHPLHSELNFPLGSRMPLDPAPLRWHMVMHLYDVLTWASLGVMNDPTMLERYAPARELAKEIQALLVEGVAKHVVAFKPHLKLLDQRYYDAHLAEPMAKWLILWLRLNNLDGFATVSDTALLAAVLRYEVPRQVESAGNNEAWIEPLPPHTSAPRWLTSFANHWLRSRP